MKRCENGHITHNDSLNFCTQCGGVLSPYTPTEGTTTKTDGGSTPPPPSPVKKKRSIGGILKRVFIGIVVVIAVLCIWVMSKINSTTYLTFNTEGVIFAKGGETATVNIDYDGIIWEVTYSPSWLTALEDDENNTLTLIASGNETGANREDHITVKSGKVVQQLPVVQRGYATYIHVSPPKLDLGRGGGSKYIEFESDGLSATINYPDFCSIKHEGEGFYVKFTRNEGFTREGKIELNEDGCKTYINYHQRGDCKSCNGRGSRDCNSCGGTGYVGFGMFSSRCIFCGGQGRFTCSACNGLGER